MGGTVAEPQPRPGNEISAIKVTNVKGSYTQRVNDTRNDIYSLLTTNTV